MKHGIAILLICVFGTAAAHAADISPEKRWSDLLEKHITRGRAVWLETAKQRKVFAIYTADRTGKHNGTVIVLHDMGQHPDWPDVVRPLREKLPDHGWSTLSVQMPVLGRDAPIAKYGPLFDDVAPRLNAAITYLKGRQAGTIALAGYGVGAAMGAAYLAANPSSGVQTFIAVGMGVLKGMDPRLDTTTSLEKLNLPVLDIFGSRDFVWVARTASARADAARTAGARAQQPRDLSPGRHPAAAESPSTEASGHLSYRQMPITGADHYFTGLSDTLVRRITGWLNKNKPPPTVAGK
jgi:pimeloyl-ACP methyl ester carboxylesterase